MTDQLALVTQVDRTAHEIKPIFRLPHIRKLIPRGIEQCDFTEARTYHAASVTKVLPSASCSRASRRRERVMVAVVRLDSS